MSPKSRRSCSVCKEGKLFNKLVPKFGSLLRMIGIVMIICSIIGMLLSFVSGFFTFGLGFIGIFFELIFFGVGLILMRQEKALQCGTCKRIFHRR